MKKFLKFLGAAAVIASVVPYRVEKKGGRKIYTALLWRGSNQPDPDTGSRSVCVDLSFNNPFSVPGETHLFADEITVDYGGKNEEDAAGTTGGDQAGETEEKTEEKTEETAGNEAGKPDGPAEDAASRTDGAGA